MKLASVRIQNFRSVEDSNEFTVENVTCLVGKNEAGKTAILQALHREKPHDGAKFDVDRDYPRRHLADYTSRHPTEAAPVLSLLWRLDAEDRTDLAELLGPEGAKVAEVRTQRKYVGPHTWSMGLSDVPVIKYLAEKFALSSEENEHIKDLQTIGELKVEIAKFKSPSADAMMTELNTRFARDSASLAAIDLLVPRLPKMLYFSHYDRIRGRISLDALRAKLQASPKQPLSTDEQLFCDFCEFAGTNALELATIDTFEKLKAKFEGASNKITRKVFEYWSQNPYLRVEFSHDAALAKDDPPFNSGRVFNIRIRNDLHGVTVPFDERSAGFVWFFSFLVAFSQVKGKDASGIILLLDEPGLNLHAKAQEDLLRFIEEELAPNHQVIYTTHSPFLVPSAKLPSVRVVEDVVVERPRKQPEIHGTKVSSDPLTVGPDTLFPLQSALGFAITQTLFVGKNTLVVEGPSDLIYFSLFSQELKTRKRSFLDQRWVVCPVGGIDKIPAFMALFGANKMNLAVVLDVASGSKKKATEIQKLSESVLRTGKVFTLSTVAGQAEADIEDVIGAENYLSLINECYALAPPIVLPPGHTGRVMEYVEAQMRLRADFDHFTPASYLLLNQAAVMGKMPSLEASLDRFESLFKDINALLS